jgi:hypothetical protein
MSIESGHYRIRNLYTNFYLVAGLELQAGAAKPYDDDRSYVSLRDWNSYNHTKWEVSTESNKILLKNIHIGEYLYAASDHFAYDNDRRTCFTWRNGEKVTQGYWEVLKTNSGYTIKNTTHGEYLYASKIGKYKVGNNEPGNHIYVYTWRPKVHVRECYWDFEKQNY